MESSRPLSTHSSAWISTQFHTLRTCFQLYPSFVNCSSKLPTTELPLSLHRCLKKKKKSPGCQFPFSLSLLWEMQHAFWHQNARFSSLIHKCSSKLLSQRVASFLCIYNCKKEHRTLLALGCQVLSISIIHKMQQHAL